MTTYQLGETIKFTATITDTAGDAADPTTTTISIRSPDRAMAVTDQAMTKAATGLYTYKYTIPAEPDGIEGTYTVKVETTGSESDVTIEPAEFKAEASI